LPLIQLDPAILPVYEIGAAVIAALCFSAPKDKDDVRGKAHRAMCSWAIREGAHLDPDWAGAPQLVRPIYAAWPESERKRASANSTAA
jgi:hypothetical protein